ncbi:MAG: hypothetical protein JXQ75_19925 [Phycisphaerae bacterium]|nr:hypothetical protein [Phycisphaerae bacterium]
MNAILRVVPLACTFGLLTAVAGCGGGKAYHAGRTAEKEGSPPVAYDAYCRAGQKNPGSSAVAAGIKRTRAAAAAFWESEAIAAMDEGRQADAWRMWMRTLTISPNHSTAPGIVRKIEQQHPGAVADVRADWLRRGYASLALAEPSGHVAVATAGTSMPREETGAHRPRGQVDGSQAEPMTAAASGAAPGGTQAASPSRVQEAASIPSEDATGSMVAAPPNTSDGGDGDAEVGEARVGLSTVIAKAASEASQARAPSADGEGAEVATKPPSHATSLDPDLGDKPSEQRQPAAATRPATHDVEFLVIQTLSRKNRRYPKQAEIIDGITAKLKDTDGDLDADINLYDGDRRVKKIRELPVGRSATFTGCSGNRYRLTILSVHHKTHTVRIGIKPV